MQSRCRICDVDAEFSPAFKVPFPDLSPTRGQAGWGFDEVPDVPTWSFYRCGNCTVTHPIPFPSEQDIDQFYAQHSVASGWEMEHYVEINEDRRAGERALVERLELMMGRRGRLLEVGPAAGWLLSAAAERGWEVAGIEPAPAFQKYATSQLGLPVHLGTIASADLPVASFDVIVLRDVLEHLHNPVRDLAKLRSWLAPQGRILIETLNIGSRVARLYGLRWRQMVVSHTFYWTRDSLMAAVHKAGLDVYDLSEPRYWHPHKRAERRRQVAEVGKFLSRLVAVAIYVKPAMKWPNLVRLPEFITLGRLTHDDVLFKVGDQAVLGDVVLCIAGRADGGAAASASTD